MSAAETQEATRFPNDRLNVSDALKPSVCDRLDSWKEIASYLRRSIRCVQRWEKKEGMPIFRHRHARGATVYAYRQELDDWWNGGREIQQSVTTR